MHESCFEKFPIGEEIPAGQYELDFRFKLDSNLPSSLKETWTDHEDIGSAYINYKAIIRLEGVGAHNGFNTLKQELNFHVDNEKFLYPHESLNHTLKRYF